jgi:hypothetical protein
VQVFVPRSPGLIFMLHVWYSANGEAAEVQPISLLVLSGLKGAHAICYITYASNLRKPSFQSAGAEHASQFFFFI